MNPCHWWSWCIIILQIVYTQHILANDINEGKLTPAEVTNTHQDRQRRDLEWAETNRPYTQDEVDDVNLLPTFPKRNPILSRWGGQRLSDLLYFKRRPAFSSWGGKRGPAFSSWGGKRSINNNMFGLNHDDRPNNSTEASENYDNLLLDDQDEDDPELTPENNVEEFLKNEYFKDIAAKNHIEHDDNDRQDSVVLKDIRNKMHPADRNKLCETDDDKLVNDDREECESSDDDDADFNLENDKIRLLTTHDKRSSPSFNSWGGKRALTSASWLSKWFPTFNHWQGKKATAFNSWGGKRAPAFNSWGGKRAPAFNSWGGKRAVAFNSWGGKRAPAFNSWGGKRAPAFNSWGGKRAPAFNSWGGKRAIAFNSWGGKRTLDYHDLTDKEQKEDDEEGSNWEDILKPAENKQREKRSASFPYSKEKHLPAFNTLEGIGRYDHTNNNDKRAIAFNSWGGKRAPAFNSWGGKRAPAFNSWGGKRAPAFNSWGGKRMLADNEQDKNTLESDYRDDVQLPPYILESKRIYEDSLGDKRDSTLSRGSGKRLPAFHSWGGKRFQLTTLEPHEGTDSFLGSGTNQNHPPDSIKTIKAIATLVSEILHQKDIENYERNFARNEDQDNRYELMPHFRYNGENNVPQENINKSNENLKEINHLVKRSNPTGKQDTTTERPNKVNDQDVKTQSPKKLDAFPVSNRNSETIKHNVGVKYNSKPQHSKPYSADKRQPIYSNWSGKRSDPTTEEEKEHIRKKRYVGNGEENAIELILTGNDVAGNSIGTTPIDEIYSAIPNDMTVCCIKRAQFGDRNLFMQMLLRTKNFRDLSWPSIRPIRRGAEFYPWGGKRSLL